MSKYKNKTYCLRLPDELRLKVEAIAKERNMKTSQLYKEIVGIYVMQYENINGKIDV